MEHDSTEKKDTVFRVLYLFCGKPRKSDLRAWLTRLAPGFKCTVHVREVDIARSSEDDLSGEGLWQKFFTEVAEGKWDAVFLSPPCNTFSRARHLWKRSPGPRPIRSKHYPYGFPWVSAANKQTLGEHNFFIFQCKRMATTAESKTRTMPLEASGNGMNYAHCNWNRTQQHGQSTNAILAQTHPSPPGSWETLTRKCPTAGGQLLMQKVFTLDLWGLAVVIGSMCVS